MSEPSMVSLDASSLGDVFKQLEQQYAGSTEKALGQIAFILVGLVDDEFETAGHGKWPPLAKATLAKRRKKGKGAEILKDSGLAAGSVWPLHDAESAEAYTNVPYMVFHVSDKPRHVIPLRNPFDIPQEQVLEQAADILLMALSAQ